MAPTATTNSSDSDVQVDIVRRGPSGPRFDLHYIKIAAHPVSFAPVAVYSSEDQMRFGPRSVDAPTAVLVRHVASQRRPLADPPLSIE